jgi:hypothetical protein
MTGSRSWNHAAFPLAAVVTPRMGVNVDHALLALFASQHGVASLGQLVERQLSPRTIGRARQRGELVPVLPAVYLLGGREPTFEGRAMAVQLHCGASCFLDGTTAGALYGLRSMPTSRIQVTIPGRVRVGLPAWVEASMTSWFDPDRVVVRPDGLRLAAPGMMLLALARQFNDHRFQRAAEDAWHRRLITPTAAAEFLGDVRGSGRSGVSRFRRWLEKASTQHAPAQSGLELDFVDAIRSAGLPDPERQYPVRLLSGEVIHLDLAWPNVKLAVEPGHSWWHGGDLGTRRDAARDRACGEVGWHVSRYDESARQDLAAVGRELLNTYRQRLSA